MVISIYYIFQQYYKKTCNFFTYCKEFIEFLILIFWRSMRFLVLKNIKKQLVFINVKTKTKSSKKYFLFPL